MNQRVLRLYGGSAILGQSYTIVAKPHDCLPLVSTGHSFENWRHFWIRRVDTAPKQGWSQMQPQIPNACGVDRCTSPSRILHRCRVSSGHTARAITPSPIQRLHHSGGGQKKPLRGTLPNIVSKAGMGQSFPLSSPLFWFEGCICRYLSGGRWFLKTMLMYPRFGWCSVSTLEELLCVKMAYMLFKLGRWIFFMNAL